jgi:Flp pilus assembly protein TadG
MAHWRRRRAMFRLNPGRCRGAALLEFHIVALLALMPMCLGTLQMALLLVENHHLDHAAFLAARYGAVRQGDMSEVRRAFAQGVSILYVGSTTPLDRSNVLERVASAYAAATADIAVHARVRLLSPTAEAHADFAVRRNAEQVIPNDALEFRSTAPGRRSGISLQQANVLRLEFTYCRPLIVPFARQLMLGTLRLLDHDPWHQRCYAAGRIPVRSEGVAPMQSDFRVSS